MSHTDKNAATAHGGTATIDADLGAALASAALDVARRFAAGATMWCVAPHWTEHARHVAVEFVHPVIVGKRALPAVSVDAPDPIAALRTVSAAGDVLAILGSADTIGATALLRRAEAWGLTTVWIGAGPRPPARRRPSRAVGRRTAARRRSPRRLGRQAVPPAVGAHPCLLRTPGRGRAARRRRRAGLHHLLRRGTAGRGAGGRTRRAGERALGRRHRDGRHGARRTGRGRRPRPRPRRHGDRR